MDSVIRNSTKKEQITADKWHEKSETLFVRFVCTTPEALMS